MTADGLTTVGGSSGSSGSSTRPGRDEVSPTPEHLSVTGRISLPYSRFRVGLYYYDGTSSIRNSTLESANLENEVGSGYLFGYYDSNRIFHQVGYTAETAITMAMDKNVTISSGASLGCYHILLPGSYMSFEEAASAALAIRRFPGLLQRRLLRPLRQLCYLRRGAGRPQLVRYRRPGLHRLAVLRHSMPHDGRGHTI